MKTTLQRSLIFLGLLACAGTIAAASERAAEPVAQEASAVTPDARWKVWGGEAGFRWNRSLIADMGITLAPHEGTEGRNKRGRRSTTFLVRDSSALDFDVSNGNFAGFTGGSLALRGGYDLHTAKGTAALRDARLVPRADNRFVLDVVGSDGVVWFYIDRMMYEVEHDKGIPVLEIKAMDLRIAPALADLLGEKNFTDLTMADMWMSNRIHSDSGDPAVFHAKGSSGHWPGDPVAGVPGSTYQADVFMHHFTGQYSRRDGAGNAVFTPSSTLRNNRNNGTRVNTFPTLTPISGGAFDPGPGPADPGYETRLNASTALYAAHVPWYTKFDDGHAPYNNDQHPYLIWNLYRINADGDFEQIGRSGVKHAWLTTNSPCDESPPSNHVLARGCADTYGVGNNDAIDDLGPRSEIIPATGEWGRCSSVYDKNCDGNQDSGAPCPGLTGPALEACEDYSFRMIVRESDINASNVGATYWYESWYIVREDINIYNTMQNRPVTLSFSGSTWTLGNGPNTAVRLGPAIDRWVDPATVDPNQRNTEIVSDGGHAKVAVKVTDLGAGRFRYDYAVMNFDFARAQTVRRTNGLEVLSNDGFVEFALPVAASALTITDKEFSDGDTNAANDWVVSEEANRIVWTAPAGNRLNWGTMFRFSLTANAVPVEADANLTTALTSSVETLQAASLVPQSEAVATYAVGGELTGLAAGESVSLRLNAGTPIQLDANDVFAFPDELIEGSSYTVAISAQPVTQNCTIAHETGTIEGADIVDVLVTCVDLPPPMYSVSGSVAGLDSGRSVTLRLNGGETLLQGGNGVFEFTTLLGDEAAYNVTATADAPDRLCVVSNGSGFVADADVTGVQVVCGAAPTYAIGGAVSGLVSGASVGLQLNGGEILLRSANSPFVFAGELLDEAAFVVTIVTQPVGMHCEIAGGEGNVDGADVDGIAVTCVELSSHSVSGVLSGMPSGRSIALRLNGGPALVLSSSRSFTFTQTVFDGSDYEVTVSRAPVGYGCTIVNAAGEIDGADVDDVAVNCVSLEPGVLVYGDSFE